MKEKMHCRYLKKTGFSLLILIVFGMVISTFAPMKCIAASVYLPTKVKVYYYPQDTGSGRELWYKKSIKRNKYGMVTSITDQEGNNKTKSTFKYSFTKGLVTKVTYTTQQNKGKKFTSTEKYKYNKYGKVISHHSYNNKSEFDGKSLYTYKGKKLIKKREYDDKNKLANTRKYQWKKNKLTGYYVIYRGNKKGESVKYYYKGGKVAYLVEKNPNDSRTYFTKYNTDGFSTQSDAVDSIDEDQLLSIDYNNNYIDYKYNAKGRLISATDYGFMNNEKFIALKSIYSGYKKYQIPKGDPMVNDYYIYFAHAEDKITIPSVK